MDISGIVPSDMMRAPVQSSRIQRDPLESGGEKLVWRRDVTAYQERSMSVRQGGMQCRNAGWRGARVPVIELMCLNVCLQSGQNLNFTCEKVDPPQY